VCEGSCVSDLVASNNIFKIVQVKAEDMDAYAPKDLLIVTTGSQVSLHLPLPFDQFRT
jgi:hypothetical protein